MEGSGWWRVVNGKGELRWMVRAWRAGSWINTEYTEKFIEGTEKQRGRFAAEAQRARRMRGYEVGSRSWRAESTQILRPAKTNGAGLPLSG